MTSNSDADRNLNEGQSASELVDLTSTLHSQASSNHSTHSQTPSPFPAAGGGGGGADSGIGPGEQLKSSLSKVHDNSFNSNVAEPRLSSSSMTRNPPTSSSPFGY